MRKTGAVGVDISIALTASSELEVTKRMFPSIVRFLGRTRRKSHPSFIEVAIERPVGLDISTTCTELARYDETYA